MIIQHSAIILVEDCIQEGCWATSENSVQVNKGVLALGGGATVIGK